MKAAVVTDYKQTPKYQDRPAPEVQSEDILLNVQAATVNNLIRAQANGTHYSADGNLPMIPGNDGVGIDADGNRYYFNAPGALAEQVSVNSHLAFPIHGDADSAVIAATVNPAMSSYMAIKDRLGAEKVNGKKVLILGATGNAGRLAVQIAKQFGAKTVIGAGRNQAQLDLLPDLGADAVLSLRDEAAVKEAMVTIRDVDVVLDYLWGDVMTHFVMGILTHRRDHHQPLYWVQIGNIAGAEASLPGAAFRSTALTMLGSGFGSLSKADFARDLPALIDQIANGDLAVPVTTYPLEAVEAHWNDGGDRLVFLP